MQHTVNLHLPPRQADVPLEPPAAQPAAPVQGLAARRVTLLQMPRTLCRLAYGAFTTGTLTAGTAALWVLGAQAMQDPESRLLGESIQLAATTLGHVAFASLCATACAAGQAYAEERAALAPQRAAVVARREPADDSQTIEL